jgi:hypothetical protein
MASAQAIQASCQAFRIAKNIVLSVIYMRIAMEYRTVSEGSVRILNLRFAQFLCGAQELSESQIWNAVTGS